MIDGARYKENLCPSLYYSSTIFRRWQMAMVISVLDCADIARSYLLDTHMIPILAQIVYYEDTHSSLSYISYLVMTLRHSLCSPARVA